MNRNVLFVDDDPNILDSYKRRLRKLFKIDTALSGAEGLARLAAAPPYAVIVSDFRMPVMDGVQFLVRARQAAPDTVRMMLTGYADFDAAIEAINSGNIFRFMTKPCGPEQLAQALAAGVKQYQLIMAERELLEQTLNGCIKVLSEVLALLNPEAFDRALRVAAHATRIAKQLGLNQLWQLETAARLSQLGCITLPEETLNKVYQGEALSTEEQQVFAMHPYVASDLLKKIPRMDEIARIIAHQEAHFDGSGVGGNQIGGADIPLGSRILKVALDFETLEVSGTSKANALVELRRRTGWYDPEVLAALDQAIATEIAFSQEQVGLAGLTEGMLVGEDIHTNDGRLLVKRGARVTEPFIRRLECFARTHGVREPITVLVPQK